MLPAESYMAGDLQLALVQDPAPQPSASMLADVCARHAVFGLLSSSLQLQLRRDPSCALAHVSIHGAADILSFMPRYRKLT